MANEPKTPRFYLPPLSVLTAAAVSLYVAFGTALVIGLWSLHWAVALIAGVLLSGVAYVAAESHAASVRVPPDVFRGSGSGFTDPEDQPDEQPAGRDSGRFDDGGRW